jgi:hypothetical protein
VADDALARFDELTAAASSTPRIENAAARTMEGFASAWEARDWERFAALFSAGFRGIDHPRFALPYLGRDQHLEALRMRFAMSSSRLTLEMLATRGDRLVLVRSHFEGADRDVGPSETETLLICEVDERGDLVAIVYFEPDEFDAAYAELDNRNAAGEAAACARVSATMQAFTRAFAARDWDALAALFAPDLVASDHRLLGWETLHGPAAYVETLRSLVDLAPDARLRLDHVRMSERGLLWAGAWVGTRDGGAFETPWITVSEHCELGTVLRFDQYDLDQLDAALARFEELRPDPLHIPPNAASRAIEYSYEALAAHDTAALRALTSDDFVYEDRGKRSLTIGGAEPWIETLQFSSHRAGSRARN